MSTLTVGAAGVGGAYDYTCDGTADHADLDALAEDDAQDAATTITIIMKA